MESTSVTHTSPPSLSNSMDNGDAIHAQASFGSRDVSEFTPEESHLAQLAETDTRTFTKRVLKDYKISILQKIKKYIAHLTPLTALGMFGGAAGGALAAAIILGIPFSIASANPLPLAISAGAGALIGCIAGPIVTLPHAFDNGDPVKDEQAKKYLYGLNEVDFMYRLTVNQIREINSDLEQSSPAERGQKLAMKSELEQKLSFLLKKRNVFIGAITDLGKRLQLNKLPTP